VSLLPKQMSPAASSKNNQHYVPAIFLGNFGLGLLHTAFNFYYVKVEIIENYKIHYFDEMSPGLFEHLSSEWMVVQRGPTFIPNLECSQRSFIRLFAGLLEIFRLSKVFLLFIRMLEALGWRTGKRVIRINDHCFCCKCQDLYLLWPIFCALLYATMVSLEEPRLAAIRGRTPSDRLIVLLRCLLQAILNIQLGIIIELWLQLYRRCLVRFILGFNQGPQEASARPEIRPTGHPLLGQCDHTAREELA
jgi:hypothetical protein